MEENLADTKFDKQWLINQLKNQGVHKVEDIFYAGIDSFNTLYVSKRNVKKEKHGKYGIE